MSASSVQTKAYNAQGAELFFQYAYAQFLTATAHVEVIEKYYKIAESVIRLKFAGKCLTHCILPALAHLEIERSAEASLTICIWDSTSTQSAKLEFPWDPKECAIRGEVEGYNDENIYTVADPYTKTLNLLNHSLNLACYWIENVRSLPFWVVGSPLQLILHWWMSHKGWQITHAAAVGYPDAGVLLAGKSGSGKSTTTLACLESGMSYVSEDYCFLSEASSSKVYAHTLYNSAKITQKTLSFFPNLEKHIEPSFKNRIHKSLLFHQRFQPHKVLKFLPLKALFILKIEENISESRLEKCSVEEALPALCVSTIWQFTHTGAKTFQHLKKVAETLPCYSLHLGKNLAQMTQLISHFLR